jgi:hypothetical protein
VEGSWVWFPGLMENDSAHAGDVAAGAGPFFRSFRMALIS